MKYATAVTFKIIASSGVEGTTSSNLIYSEAGITIHKEFERLHQLLCSSCEPGNNP
jgi:hypothetical protein